MSMILTIEVNGSAMDVFQTKTKETSYILGFDVTKSIDREGFTEYRTVEYGDDNFYDALDRFREITLSRIKYTDDIDYGNTFFLLNQIISDSINNMRTPTVKLSFQ